MRRSKHLSSLEGQLANLTTVGQVVQVGPISFYLTCIEKIFQNSLHL